MKIYLAILKWPQALIGAMHQGTINWILAASFYIYQFILRVAPTVLSHDLMAYFQITASDMGQIGAIGLFTYALFQIPGGLLMDTWGAKKTILLSILCCLSGNALFALTPTFGLALLGRALYGIGSACAFVGVSKVNSQWFPPSKSSLLFGFTMTAGTLGALLGARPLLALIAWLSWRQALLLLSFAGVILVGLFLIFFKDKPHSSKRALAVALSTVALSKNPAEPAHDLMPKTSNLLLVFRNPQAYLLGITALGVYVTISVFGDLWGVPFLRSRLGLSMEETAQLNSTIYMGLCLGGLTLTRILSWRPHWGVSLIQLSLSLIILFSGLLIWLPSLNLIMAFALLLGMGFFCGAEMVCFSKAVSLFSSTAAGTVTGFINFTVMMGGALAQQGVGLLLDYYWDGSLDPVLQIRHYSETSFQKALAVYFLLLMFCLIISLMLSNKSHLNRTQ
jgi:MFS family permease